MGIFSFLKKKEAAKPQRSAEPALKKRETVNVPGRIGNANCKYKYDGVGISLIHGVNLNSIFAQHATFDSSYSPVAVLVNGQAIGSLNNDKLSEMVYDWNRRGEPVFAVITHIDDERNEAVLDLFFYRDELKYLLRRFPDAKAYRLTGNRRGEMQDNISQCERGEECSVEYDFDKEKYVVSSTLEIGYLPAAAAKIVEAQGEENVSVYIAGINSDDEGIDFADVYIFPKKGD